MVVLIMNENNYYARSRVERLTAVEACDNKRWPGIRLLSYRRTIQLSNLCDMAEL